jgi:purine-nucleoside phosphorylase
MNVPRHQVESYFFDHPKFIGTKILFIKRDKRLAEYKQYLTDVYEFGNVWHGITGSFQGEQISIIVTGIGPSMVGDAVYALDRPNITCLYSGTCGGLDEGLEIGDYFVADQAVCDYGLTFQPARASLSTISGTPGLLNSLKAVLASKVKRVTHGAVFSTSSVAREIDPDFWKIVDKKCRAIEMATAAFYSAALETDKKAAAYSWVTDLPTRGKSFYEPLVPEDIRIRQERYDRTISLDLALLSCL